MNRVYHFNELDYIASEIIRWSKHSIIRIDGALGAGKTSLIQAICKQIGITSVVQSPTFSIINQFESPHGIVYHFDFYRIKKKEEALDLGVLELFETAHLNLIEWGENIVDMLPQQIDHFQLDTINEFQRKIYQLK